MVALDGREPVARAHRLDHADVLGAEEDQVARPRRLAGRHEPAGALAPVVDLRDGRARLYPGNYTETAEARAERRKRPEPPAPAPSAAAPRPVEAGPPPAAPRPPTPSKRAESAEEKEAARRRRRIRALEEKIEALETEIETIETRLWEEALTLGPVASRELAQRKTGLREELDGLVEEWAKLSEESEKPARQS